MIIREVRPEERQAFNQAVRHPLQSWEWGEFREKTGVVPVRLGRFEGSQLIDGWQITFHKLPKVAFTAGYLPKCSLPDAQVLAALKEIGRQHQALFIKLEPNVGQPLGQAGLPYQESSSGHKQIKRFLLDHSCVYGRPLFTKYTFQIDLTLSEEELLGRMKQKTRYNIGLAHRKGVTISEDSSETAFREHLDLTFQTTKRQGFYAHDRRYHTDMWQTLRPAGVAHLLKASWQGKTLVTWIVFIFQDTLYYPYGASSSQYREVMASNLMMWEAIRFGKHLHLKTFDLWGSLGPEADPKDPWFGFHHFKEGFGPTLIEFVGTFDYVLDPPKYQVYRALENLRWKWLRLRARLPL
jgi:lipid II:glycine glycyltransferase (peptidoglycan interpeptide bridge formation enzyme)